MRVTRRTARTAAVAAGAFAVLAVPAGAAFAAAPATPAPQPAPGIDQPAQPDGQQNKDETVPDETAPVETLPDTAGLRAFVTTVKLADGSVAKVYSFGDGHFEAEISAAGVTLDTLVSKDGEPAYGQNNGLHVVLQPNGTVTSWIEDGGTKDEPKKDESGKPQPRPQPQPRPKPQPQPKKDESRHVSPVRVTLPDGRIAKLVKGGPAGPRAEISLPNGSFLGAVDLGNPVTTDGGWTYKIVKDGKRATFVVIDGKKGGFTRVYAFDGRLVEKYETPRDGKRHDREKTVHGARTADKPADKPAVTADGRVVPKGGVKAGAEGVEAGSSQAPVLLAAGGGMAAVGAAGLGFALLRRGGRQG